MDRTTFLEAVLADYIARISPMSREQLLQEAIELKSLVLEFASDEEILKQHYGSRHIDN